MIETENSSSIHDEHIINAVEIPSTVSIAVKKHKSKSFFNSDPEDYSLEMKEHDQWVLSCLKAKADGTYTKIPCNADGYYCDCTDQNNCMSFEKAFEICEANPDKFSGIGFSVSSSGTIKAIDCDHVYDPVTGEWNQQAWQELRSLNTRVEWSPSHTGVHLFFTCPIMLENGKKTQPDDTGREMYSDKHYLTVTGEVVEDFTDVINKVDPELITQLYDKWFPGKRTSVKAEVPVKYDIRTFEIPEEFVNDPDDPLKDLSPTKDQVRELCRNAPHGFGESFTKLMAGNISEYESDESDADMAIAGMIAFHTSDYSIIKEIIRESKLWDEKWEREDYCRGTIIKAIENSRWSKTNQMAATIDRQLELPVATQTVVHESPEVANDDCQRVESATDITESIIPKEYSVSGEGLKLQKFDSKAGNVYNETICYSPIYLTGASQDIDTNEISYEVSFTDSIGRQHKSMYMQSELITTAKLKQTALANQINLIDTQISNLCKYFNKCIRDNARTLPFTIMANKYGWRKEDTFIIGNRMISKDGVKPIRSMQETEKYETKGSLKEWIKAIEPVVNDDTVRFKCYGVLAVPLLKLFNVQSFIVDHFGHSSKGKTFGLQVAMSLMGDPKNLLVPANSSLSHIEMQAAICNDLALALDETSLQDTPVLDKIIYMIANEGGRGRATNAKLQKINRWRTITFTTGENTIINTKLNGAGVRAISFNIPMKVMDAGQVEKSRAIIERNYGHIIELYMARVFQNKDKLKKQFDEVQKQFIRDGQSTMLNRMGSYFVIIAVAGSILEDIFKDIGISQVDHIELVRTFFNDLKEHEQEPYHVKALRFLNDFFNVHANNFLENENSIHSNRDIYGYISEEYIDAIPKVVKDALKEGQFNESVIGDLIKEGIIITNKGRPDFKITLKSNGSQPHVYRFDIAKMRQKLEN